MIPFIPLVPSTPSAGTNQTNPSTQSTDSATGSFDLAMCRALGTGKKTQTLKVEPESNAAPEKAGRSRSASWNRTIGRRSVSPNIVPQTLDPQAKVVSEAAEDPSDIQDTAKLPTATPFPTPPGLIIAAEKRKSTHRLDRAPASSSAPLDGAGCSVSVPGKDELLTQLVASLSQDCSAAPELNVTEPALGKASTLLSPFSSQANRGRVAVAERTGSKNAVSGSTARRSNAAAALPKVGLPPSVIVAPRLDSSVAQSPARPTASQAPVSLNDLATIDGEALENVRTILPNPLGHYLAQPDLSPGSSQEISKVFGPSLPADSAPLIDATSIREEAPATKSILPADQVSGRSVSVASSRSAEFDKAAQIPRQTAGLVLPKPEPQITPESSDPSSQPIAQSFGRQQIQIATEVSTFGPEMSTVKAMHPDRELLTHELAPRDLNRTVPKSTAFERPIVFDGPEVVGSLNNARPVRLPPERLVFSPAVSPQITPSSDSTGVSLHLQHSVEMGLIGKGLSVETQRQFSPPISPIVAERESLAIRRAQWLSSASASREPLANASGQNAIALIPTPSIAASLASFSDSQAEPTSPPDAVAVISPGGFSNSTLLESRPEELTTSALGAMLTAKNLVGNDSAGPGQLASKLGEPEAPQHIMPGFTAVTLPSKPEPASIGTMAPTQTPSQTVAAVPFKAPMAPRENESRVPTVEATPLAGNGLRTDPAPGEVLLPPPGLAQPMLSEPTASKELPSSLIKPDSSVPTSTATAISLSANSPPRTNLPAEAKKSERSLGSANRSGFGLTIHTADTGRLGTPVAQQETSMKKGQTEQKSAGLGEQNLPSPGTVFAGPERPRSDKTHSVSGAVDTDKLASGVKAEGLENSKGVVLPTPAEAKIISTEDLRPQPFERLHDLVATHALRLAHSGSDSMRVVLDPGDGTRLSLELRLNNGAVEAQALLHRGDFNLLSGQWADLQQRLEPRGIHLAPLECQTSGSEQQSFQQSQRHPAEEQSNRSAFAEFAFEGSMEDLPATRREHVKKHNGWETWA